MAKRAGAKAGTHVTAQDVARTLGVSQSTISRAFSMTASISEDMKLRVIKAANKLGYQPNVIARSLITRRSRIIALGEPGQFSKFITPAIIAENSASFLQGK